MMKTKETGHAKNVANFQTLISYCYGYGASYNPGNAAMRLVALSTLHNSAKAAIDAVTFAKAGYDHATNEREIAFEHIPKLCTRIVNALAASGTSEQKIKDARSIINRMLGKRAGKKPSPKTGEEITNEQPVKQSISVSHTSYDTKLATLESLVQLLLTEPHYQPNEMELSILGLNNLVTQLSNLTDQVKQQMVTLSNARIKRDDLLYLAENNLCELAQDVKKYVKSLFGTGSAQFKQVSTIKFTTLTTLV